MIAPVGAYDGRSVTDPAFAMVVGGHMIPWVAVAGIPLALGSPVEVRGNAFLHTPCAARGSFGIQPFSRPS
jgi:hypothetical protein